MGRRHRCRSSGEWAAASCHTGQEQESPGCSPGSDVGFFFIENKTGSKDMLDIHMQPRQEMVKSHFHDPLDAEPVNVPHGEVLNAQVLQNVTGMTVKHSFSHECWNIKVATEAQRLTGRLETQGYLLISTFSAGSCQLHCKAAPLGSNTGRIKI